MFGLNEIISYFKEVSHSLKFQLSAALTFGTALALVWFKEDNELKIILTILFLFPTCMFIGSLIEKAMLFSKKKKERKSQIIQSKLGLLGQHQFTDKLSELWQDQNFKGLGWQVYVNTASNDAYLTHPCCFECKTNLTARINLRCDGFYLECEDCKKKFEVDDIGEKRSLANSSLQGDVRRNPDKYFGWY